MKSRKTPSRQVALLAGIALAIISTWMPGAARGADSSELKASQTDEIKKHEGRKVTVRGKAREVGATGSGSLQFLNFDGASFSVILRKQNREKVEKDLGIAFSALAGREITVRGEVSLYQGRPQIEVTEARQLEIGVAPVAQDRKPPAIAITETAALKAAEKKIVQVEGKVRAVGQSKSGNVIFINFEGVERGGFSCVVMAPNRNALEVALGGDLTDVFPGKTIQIHGPVAIFSDAPQIEIKSADQVLIR